MAITRPVREVSLKLLTEYTSRNTILGRFVQRNPDTGFIESKYPVTVHAEQTTYEIDQDGNKLDIYEQFEIGQFELTAPEIMTLWTTPVTTQEGDTVMLGNLIADKIDAIIDARIAAGDTGATVI
jgi:hypothetical protein